jgi:hypothetical protein
MTFPSQPDKPSGKPSEPGTPATVEGYPLFRFGARWICDGPLGRFHTRTKSEATELLYADIAAAGVSDEQ